MLAVVRTLRTKKVSFRVKGDIPRRLMKFLREEYGKHLMIIEAEETVDITKTDWYQKKKDSSSPGKTVRVLRKRDRLTQAELGQMLGGLSVQKISDIELGRRGISKSVAMKLSAVFCSPVEKFL